MDMTALDAYQFCVLHTQTDRWLRLKVAEALEPSSLTMMEWLLLQSTDKEDTSTITITDAADLLGVSLPQVTALVHRLKKQGLVKQKVSVADRRSRYLELTIKGKAIRQKANKNVRNTILHKLKEPPHLKPYSELLRQFTASYIDV